MISAAASCRPLAGQHCTGAGSPAPPSSSPKLSTCACCQVRTVLQGCWEGLEPVQLWLAGKGPNTPGSVGGAAGPSTHLTAPTHPPTTAGGNAWYQQLSFSSFAEPITSVSINGQALKKDARLSSRFGRHAGWNARAVGPCAAAGAGGHVGTQQVTELLACCNLPLCHRWGWSATGGKINATPPISVNLTAASGKKQVARLPSLRGQQDLGVQFF